MTTRLTKEFWKIKNNHIGDKVLVNDNPGNNAIIYNLQNNWEISNNLHYHLLVDFSKINLYNYHHQIVDYGGGVDNLPGRKTKKYKIIKTTTTK